MKSIILTTHCTTIFKVLKVASARMNDAIHYARYHNIIVFLQTKIRAKPHFDLNSSASDIEKNGGVFNRITTPNLSDKSSDYTETCPQNHRKALISPSLSNSNQTRISIGCASGLTRSEVLMMNASPVSAIERTEHDTTTTQHRLSPIQFTDHLLRRQHQ